MTEPTAPLAADSPDPAAICGRAPGTCDDGLLDLFGIGTAMCLVGDDGRCIRRVSPADRTA